jgi:hypothetical protein
VDAGLGDRRGIEASCGGREPPQLYYDPVVFMAYKRALGSDLIILKDDAYDRVAFEKEFPDIAKMGSQLRERGKDINPQLIEANETRWIERFEEIKLGN